MTQSVSKLGKIITQLREGKSYSKRKLSIASGVNPSLISRIENGTSQTMTAENLKKLSLALDVDYEIFLEAAGIIHKSDKTFDDLFHINEEESDYDNALTDENIFGIRLKESIKIAKVSQKDLAQYIQTSRMTVSRYIRGESQPDIMTLAKIAYFLSTSTDYLLGLCTESEPSKMPLENNIGDDITKLLVQSGLVQHGESIPTELEENILEMTKILIKMTQSSS